MGLIPAPELDVVMVPLYAIAFFGTMLTTAIDRPHRYKRTRRIAGGHIGSAVYVAALALVAFVASNADTPAERGPDATVWEVETLYDPVQPAPVPSAVIVAPGAAP